MINIQRIKENCARQRFFVFFFLFLANFLFCNCFLFAQGDQDTLSSQEDLSISCFSSEDCQQPGMIGICEDAGKKTARCVWKEDLPIDVFVMVPDICHSCQTEAVIEKLKKVFPSIQSIYLKETDQKAQDIKKSFDIMMLPAYFFPQEVQGQEAFHHFQTMTVYQDGWYYLKPEHSGVSFFLGRLPQENQLDLFVILTQPDAITAIDLARDILKNDKTVQLNIHLIGQQDPQTQEILTPMGSREIEEGCLFACVEKHYPFKALEYLSCRLKGLSSLWWEDCLQGRNMNIGRIKKCARSQEGQTLFEKKIRLSQEVGVYYAPLFLMKNIEIFGISDQTTAHEILKLLKSEK